MPDGRGARLLPPLPRPLRHDGGGRRGHDDAAARDRRRARRRAPAVATGQGGGVARRPVRWPRRLRCRLRLERGRRWRTTASIRRSAAPSSASTCGDPRPVGRRRRRARRHLRRRSRRRGRCPSRCQTRRAGAGPPILLGAGAGPSERSATCSTLADGWYPLTGPTLLEDAARLRALAAERGRRVEVSVVEMAGQMAGVPWYCDDDARATPARSTSPSATPTAASTGSWSASPSTSRGHLEDALAVLAESPRRAGATRRGRRPSHVLRREVPDADR